MKPIVIVMGLFLVFSLETNAQEIGKVDQSPLDLAVFRPDGRGTEPAARIYYGRPLKKGRQMLGGKIAYGKVWRLGANESTEINLFKDITFAGKKLRAGSYTMYAIPNADKWTLIFNSKLHTWGAFTYDESKNVIQVEVPVSKVSASREAFGMAFDGKDGKGKLLMAWEDVEVYVPFTY